MAYFLKADVIIKHNQRTKTLIILSDTKYITFFKANLKDVIQYSLLLFYFLYCVFFSNRMTSVIYFSWLEYIDTNISMNAHHKLNNVNKYTKAKELSVVCSKKRGPKENKMPGRSTISLTESVFMVSNRFEKFR